MKAGLEPGMSHTTTEERQTPPSILAMGGGPDTYWIGDIAGTMERTARRWLTAFCEGDEQTVGVRVCVVRTEPLALGRLVTATSTLTKVEGRRYYFDIEAMNEHGDVLARGTHERRLIGQQQFAPR